MRSGGLERWEGAVCRKILESTDWLMDFQKSIWSKLLNAIWVKPKQSRETERPVISPATSSFVFIYPRMWYPFLLATFTLVSPMDCHGCADHIHSHGECQHSPLFLYTLSRCVHLASKHCYVTHMFTDHCLFEN